MSHFERLRVLYACGNKLGNYEEEERMEKRGAGRVKEVFLEEILIYSPFGEGKVDPPLKERGVEGRIVVEWSHLFEVNVTERKVLVDYRREGKG
jgi:hypothetical protein